MNHFNPVARRRSFAIISHPDAGKTTLTEKHLLFGGAIQLASEVRAKATRSDWMGIERERGISIVTSVIAGRPVPSTHVEMAYLQEPKRRRS